MQDVMQIIEQITDRIYEEHDRPVPERLSALVTQISPHYARIRSPRILLDIQRNAPSVWSEWETWRLWRYTKFRAIIEDGVVQEVIRSDIKIDDIIAYYTVMANSCMEYSVYVESDVSSLDLY